MVFRDRTRGRPEGRDDQVTAAEEILGQMAAAVPIRREEVSPELLRALEEAERRADEVADIGEHFDQLIGRREGADELLGSLDAFEHVPGLDQQLDILREQITEAQTLLHPEEGRVSAEDRERANELLEQARLRIERLPDIVRTIRELSVAGAPESFIEHTAAGLQFFGTEEQARGELILRGAHTFIENREILLSPAGSTALMQLTAGMERFATPEAELDTGQAGAAMDNFSDAMQELRTERTEAVQSAFGYQRQTLMESLEGMRQGEMRSQIERAISDLDGMLARLREDASQVGADEIARMSRRTLDIGRMVDDLATIRTDAVRQQVERTYGAALDVLASGGGMETYDTLMLASDEMVRHQERGDSAYRRELASRVASVRQLYRPEEEATDAIRGQRTAAEGALVSTLAERFAGRLEESAGTLAGDARERLGRIAASARDADGLADLQRARAALDIAESVTARLGAARSPSPEVSEGATAIYARGLQVLEDGGDVRVARAQMDLAVRFVEAESVQRVEIEQLSGRLQSGGEQVLASAEQYFMLDNQIREFTSGNARALLRHTAGAEQMGRLVSALEEARAGIASGELVTDEQVTARRMELEQQMDQDAGVRRGTEVMVERIRGSNPEMTEDQALDEIARQNLIAEANDRVDQLVQSGTAMLEQLGSTRQPEFRSEISEIYGFSIDAIIDGDFDSGTTYRQAATAYFELGRSSVTEARERAVVLDTARQLHEGRIDGQVAASVFEVQRLRAEHESNTTDARELRNVRAYFDFALQAASGRSPDTAEAVREAAVMYASWANKDVSGLRDEERSARTEAMEFVQSQLGDYRSGRLLGGRRIADLGAEGREALRLDEGSVDAPLGSALIEEAMGRNSLVGSLADGDAQGALAEVQQFASTTRMHMRGFERASFELRCRGLESADSTRYEREAARLGQLAARVRGGGGDALARHYDFQASMVSTEFTGLAATVARDTYRSGAEARERAHGFLDEAQRSATADMETVNSRIEELTAALPERARAQFSQQVESARAIEDSDGREDALRTLYDQLLQVHGGMAMREADGHFECAAQVLDGAETFDRSVALTVRRRHRGRFELYTGTHVAIGLARGHDVDLLGNEIARGGEPVELTEERERTLDAHARSLVGLGTVAVRALEATQATRDRGLRNARESIHERNIEGLEDRIGRMISTLPATGEGRVRREQYERMFERARGNLASLQSLYDDVASMGHLHVVDERGRQIYDAAHFESEYQRVRGIWLAEDFRQASEQTGLVAFRLRGAHERVDIRITGRAARTEFFGAIDRPVAIGEEVPIYSGAPGEEEYLDRLASDWEPATTEDIARVRDEVLTMAGYLGDSGEYAGRLSRLPPTINPGSPEYRELLALRRELLRERVGFPGAPARPMSEVVGRDTVYYDGEWLDGRVVSALQLADSGRLGDAQSALAAVTGDRMRAAAAQSADSRRLGFRYQAWRRELEAIGLRRELMEGAPTTSEDPTPRAQRQDRNEVFETPLEDMRRSMLRSADDLRGTAGEFASARNQLLAGGAILAATTDSVLEMVSRMSDEQREQLVPGTELTYAQLARQMDETSISDPRGGAELANRIFQGILRNAELLGTVVGSIADSPPHETGFSIAEQFQLAAELAAHRTSGRERQREVAWSFARMMLSSAQEDLRLADRVELSRVEGARDQYGRFNFDAHRSHAAWAIALARGAMREGVDARFYDMLVNNEPLYIEMFEHRGVSRSWHATPDGGLLVSTRGMGGMPSGVASAMRELNIRRFREYEDYAEAAEEVNVGATMREIAEGRTTMDLTMLGVRVYDHGDGTYGLGRMPLSELTDEERARIREIRQQTGLLNGALLDTLLEHNVSIGSAGMDSFLRRMQYRHRRANDALSAVTMREVAEEPVPLERALRDSRIALGNSGEFVRRPSGVTWRMEDADSATRAAIGEMRFWRGVYESSKIVGEVVLSGALIATGNPLGMIIAAEIPLVTQLPGIAQQYQQTGVMTPELYMQTGMMIASMGLGFASAATMPVAFAEQAALRSAPSVVSPLARTATFNQRLAAAVFTPHWGQMSRAQRIVHLAGMGLMAGGTMQAIIEAPGMIEAVRSGQTHMMVAIVSLAQTVLQPVQFGMQARRTAIAGRRGTPVYRSRTAQFFEAAIFGTPFDSREAHAAALSGMRANMEFSRLPGAERRALPGRRAHEGVRLSDAQESYLSYVRELDGRGIRLTESQEADVLTSYREHCDAAVRSGEPVPAFDAFLRADSPGATEARISILESHFDAYAQGGMPYQDLSEFQQRYADAREGMRVGDDGIRRPIESGPMSEAEAYQFALDQVSRGGEPPPTPPTAPPTPTTPTLEVAPAPDVTPEPALAAPAPPPGAARAEAMAIRRDALAVRMDAAEQNVLIPPAGDVRTFTLGEGDTAIHFTPEHVRIASELVAYTERVLRTPRGEQRDAALAAVPESLRAQVERLATDPHFRRATRAEGGPERREQILLGLERTGYVEGVSREVIDSAYAVEARRIAESPDELASHMLDIAASRTEEAAQLRERADGLSEEALMHERAGQPEVAQEMRGRASRLNERAQTLEYSAGQLREEAQARIEVEQEMAVQATRASIEEQLTPMAEGGGLALGDGGQAIPIAPEHLSIASELVTNGERILALPREQRTEAIANTVPERYRRQMEQLVTDPVFRMAVRDGDSRTRAMLGLERAGYVGGVSRDIRDLSYAVQARRLAGTEGIDADYLTRLADSRTEDAAELRARADSLAEDAILARSDPERAAPLQSEASRLNEQAAILEGSASALRQEAERMARAPAREEGLLRAPSEIITGPEPEAIVRQEAEVEPVAEQIAAGAEELTGAPPPPQPEVVRPAPEPVSQEMQELLNESLFEGMQTYAELGFRVSEDGQSFVHEDVPTRRFTEDEMDIMVEIAETVANHGTGARANFEEGSPALQVYQQITRLLSDEQVANLERLGSSREVLDAIAVHVGRAEPIPDAATDTERALILSAQDALEGYRVSMSSADMRTLQDNIREQLESARSMHEDMLSILEMLPEGEAAGRANAQVLEGQARGRVEILERYAELLDQRIERMETSQEAALARLGQWYSDADQRGLRFDADILDGHRERARRAVAGLRRRLDEVNSLRAGGDSEALMMQAESLERRISSLNDVIESFMQASDGEESRARREDLSTEGRYLLEEGEHLGFNSFRVDDDSQLRLSHQDERLAGIEFSESDFNTIESLMSSFRAGLDQDIANPMVAHLYPVVEQHAPGLRERIAAANPSELPGLVAELTRSLNEGGHRIGVREGEAVRAEVTPTIERTAQRYGMETEDDGVHYILRMEGAPDITLTRMDATRAMNLAEAIGAETPQFLRGIELDIQARAELDAIIQSTIDNSEGRIATREQALEHLRQMDDAQLMRTIAPHITETAIAARLEGATPVSETVAPRRMELMRRTRERIEGSDPEVLMVGDALAELRMRERAEEMADMAVRQRLIGMIRSRAEELRAQRMQEIADARARGVPEDQLPREPTTLANNQAMYEVYRDLARPQGQREFAATRDEHRTLQEIRAEAIDEAQRTLFGSAEGDQIRLEAMTDAARAVAAIDMLNEGADTAQLGLTGADIVLVRDLQQTRTEFAQTEGIRLRAMRRRTELRADGAGDAEAQLIAAAEGLSRGESAELQGIREDTERVARFLLANPEFSQADTDGRIRIANETLETLTARLPEQMDTNDTLALELNQGRLQDYHASGVVPEGFEQDMRALQTLMRAGGRIAPNQEDLQIAAWGRVRRTRAGTGARQDAIMQETGLNSDRARTMASAEAMIRGATAEELGIDADVAIRATMLLGSDDFRRAAAAQDIRAMAEAEGPLPATIEPVPIDVSAPRMREEVAILSIGRLREAYQAYQRDRRRGQGEIPSEFRQEIEALEDIARSGRRPTEEDLRRVAEGRIDRIRDSLEVEALAIREQYGSSLDDARALAAARMLSRTGEGGRILYTPEELGLSDALAARALGIGQGQLPIAEGPLPQRVVRALERYVGRAGRELARRGREEAAVRDTARQMRDIYRGRVEMPEDYRQDMLTLGMITGGRSPTMLDFRRAARARIGRIRDDMEARIHVTAEAARRVRHPIEPGAPRREAPVAQPVPEPPEIVLETLAQLAADEQPIAPPEPEADIGGTARIRRPTPRPERMARPPASPEVIEPVPARAPRPAQDGGGTARIRAPRPEREEDGTRPHRAPPPITEGERTGRIRMPTPQVREERGPAPARREMHLLSLDELRAASAELMDQIRALPAGEVSSGDLLRRSGNLDEAISILEDGNYEALGFRANEDGEIFHTDTGERAYTEGNLARIRDTVEAIREGNLDAAVVRRAGLSADSSEAEILAAVLTHPELTVAAQRARLRPSALIGGDGARQAVDQALSDADAEEIPLAVGEDRRLPGAPARREALAGTPEELSSALRERLLANLYGNNLRDVLEQALHDGLPGARALERIVSMSPELQDANHPMTQEFGRLPADAQVMILERLARGERFEGAMESLPRDWASTADGLRNLVRYMEENEGGLLQMMVSSGPPELNEMVHRLSEPGLPQEIRDRMVNDWGLAQGDARAVAAEEAVISARTIPEITGSEMEAMQQFREETGTDVAQAYNRGLVDGVVRELEGLGVSVDRDRFSRSLLRELEGGAELPEAAIAALRDTGTELRGVSEGNIRHAFISGRSANERLFQARIGALEELGIEVGEARRHQELPAEIDILQRAVDRLAATTEPEAVAALAREYEHVFHIRPDTRVTTPTELRVHVLAGLREKIALRMARMQAIEARAGTVYDLVFRGRVQDRVSALDGYDGARISGVDRLGGISGIFRLRLDMPDGTSRNLFLKMEDSSAAVLGLGLSRSQGMISSDIHQVQHYDSGVRVDGEPVLQPISFSDDFRSLVGTEVRDVAIPGRGFVERARVESVALLDDVLSIPEPPRRPADDATPESHEAYRQDMAEYQRSLDRWMSEHESNPAMSQLIGLMQTPEGRQQVYEAWDTYIELSRRALLLDRYPRNTVVAFLEVDGQLVLTFQPIDLDLVAARIGRGPEGTDYRGFDEEFFSVTEDFADRFSRALRLARDQSAFSAPDEAVTAPEILRGLNSDEARAAADAIPLEDERLRAAQEIVSGYVEGERNRGQDAFIGAGLDTSDPGQPSIGHPIAFAGMDTPISRRDGRVRLHSDLFNRVLEENYGRRPIQPEQEPGIDRLAADSGDDFDFAFDLVDETPAPVIAGEESGGSQLARSRRLNSDGGLGEFARSVLLDTQGTGARQELESLPPNDIVRQHVEELTSGGTPDFDEAAVGRAASEINDHLFRQSSDELNSLIADEAIDAPVAEIARQLLQGRYRQEGFDESLSPHLGTIEERMRRGGSEANEAETIIDVAETLARRRPPPDGGGPGGGEPRPAPEPVLETPAADRGEVTRPLSIGTTDASTTVVTDRNLTNPTELANFAREVALARAGQLEGEGTGALAALDGMNLADPIRREVERLVGEIEIRSDGTVETNTPFSRAVFSGDPDSHLGRFVMRGVNSSAEQLGNLVAAHERGSPTPAPEPAPERTIRPPTPISRAPARREAPTEIPMPPQIEAAQQAGILNPDATEAQVSLARYAWEVARGDATVESLPPAVQDAVTMLVRNRDFASFAQSHDSDAIEAAVRQSPRRRGGVAQIGDARARASLRDLVSRAHETIPRLPEMQPAVQQMPLAAAGGGHAEAVGQLIPGQFEGARAFGHSPQFYAMMGERAIPPNIVGNLATEYTPLDRGGRDDSPRGRRFARMDELLPRDRVPTDAERAAAARQALEESAPQRSEELSVTARELYLAATELLSNDDTVRASGRARFNGMGRDMQDAVMYMITPGSEFSGNPDRMLMVADRMGGSIDSARQGSPQVDEVLVVTLEDVADIAHRMAFGNDTEREEARQALADNADFMTPEVAAAFGHFYSEMRAARGRLQVERQRADAQGRDVSPEIMQAFSVDTFLQNYEQRNRGSPEQATPPVSEARISQGTAAELQAEAGRLRTEAYRMYESGLSSMDDVRAANERFGRLMREAEALDLQAIIQEPAELARQLLQAGQDAPAEELVRRLRSAEPEQLEAFAQQRQQLAEQMMNPRPGMIEMSPAERANIAGQRSAEAQYLRDLAIEARTRAPVEEAGGAARTPRVIQREIAGNVSQLEELAGAGRINSDEYNRLLMETERLIEEIELRNFRSDEEYMRGLREDPGLEQRKGAVERAVTRWHDPEHVRSGSHSDRMHAIRQRAEGRVQLRLMREVLDGRRAAAPAPEEPALRVDTHSPRQDADGIHRRAGALFLEHGLGVYQDAGLSAQMRSLAEQGLQAEISLMRQDPEVVSRIRRAEGEGAQEYRDRMVARLEELHEQERREMRFPAPIHEDQSASRIRGNAQRRAEALLIGEAMREAAAQLRGEADDAINGVSMDDALALNIAMAREGELRHGANELEIAALQNDGTFRMPDGSANELQSRADALMQEVIGLERERRMETDPEARARLYAQEGRLDAERTLISRRVGKLRQEALTRIPLERPPESSPLARQLYDRVYHDVQRGYIDPEQLATLQADMQVLRNVDETIGRVFTGYQDGELARRTFNRMFVDELERIRNDRHMPPLERIQRISVLTRAVEHFASWAMLGSHEGQVTAHHPVVARRRVEYLNNVLLGHGNPIVISELSRRLLRPGGEVRIREYSGTLDQALADRLLGAIRPIRESTGGDSRREMVTAILNSMPDEMFGGSIEQSRNRLLAMASQSESRGRAVAAINEMLGRHGLALIEFDGRMAIYRISHEMSAGESQRVNGIFVSPLPGEPSVLRQDVGGFFSSHSGMIVLRSPRSRPRSSGEPHESHMQRKYNHELQHLVDDASGFIGMAIATHGNPGYMQYTEATAIAREMISMIESGRPLSEVYAYLEEGSREAGATWRGGFQHVLSAFGPRPEIQRRGLLRRSVAPDSPEAIAERVGRLENMIERFYLQITGRGNVERGVGFQELFPAGSRAISLEEFLASGRTGGDGGTGGLDTGMGTRFFGEE
ncbi:MAG: hypothetical protein ABIH29_01250 [Candidatus Micrarchaeota archaeon]